MLSFLLATVLLITPTLAANDAAEASRPTGAEQAREAIERAAVQKQMADKELTLRQGAAAVATQRVQEIQKQLDEAQKRAAVETQQVLVLQQTGAVLDKQLAEMKASLPLQEAADQLVLAAAKVSTRLDSLMSAQAQLQNQLAALRKSSVEWRSKSSDADQKIASIVAQRPELEKKSNETKAAVDAAEVIVNAAQIAMTTAQATVDGMTPLLTAQEEQLKTTSVSVESLNTSVASLANSLKTLSEAAKLTGNDASAAIQGLEKAIADFAPLKKNTDALMAQVTARRDDLLAKIAVAKTDLEKKTAEHKTAVAAAEPMRAAWKSASDALAAANQQESDLKVVKGDGERWQKSLNAQLTGLEPSLQKLRAETQIISSESLVASQQAESDL